MIGAYVHHHGRGHVQRAASVLGGMGADRRAGVRVLGSAPPPVSWPGDVAWTTLPRDDEPVPADDAEADAGGALHWAPLRHRGYARRMAVLADAAAGLDVGWVDVSCEVAVLWRLLGVPTVVTVQPGLRDDPPHRLAHRSASALLAPWPDLGPVPAYLEPVADRLHRVGGISRFDGRPRPDDAAVRPERDSSPHLLVLGGAGGDDTPADYWAQVARAHPHVRVTVLGGRGGTWVDDPWPLLCAADLVVTHAGLGAVADVAAAGAPAVVLPGTRPFGEQHATAAMLLEAGCAVVRATLPEPEWWAGALERTDRAAATRAWAAWGTAGAAGRAADVLGAVADRGRS